MKKLSFLTVVAGAMMFASCSDDKEVVVNNNDNAVQQIVLQVANNGDGLTTRAGRPLLSDEAAQNIQKVDMYIVKLDDEGKPSEVAKHHKNYDWNNAGTYAYGKMEAITYKGDDKLGAGSYKIYAIGYSNPSDYTIPTFTDENISKIEDYALESDIAEEIFAGSKEFSITTDKEDFTTTVVLNRQVAGAYFYVKNLPMFEGLTTDCELQLVASDYNNKLVLGNFANADIANNGNNTSTNVVNAYKNGETRETVICKTSIGAWYSEIVDADDNGLVDITNWISTKDASNRPGKGYVKGSIFASNFVMPFKKVDGKQTLTLQIVNDKGTVIRYWNINLPSDEVAETLSAYDKESGWPVDPVAAEESQNCYSILRNHLYSVGHKAAEKTPNYPEDPNKPDPEDPDPDEPSTPEDPQDISTGEFITLKVNHNWEVIHKMELD